jgi:hypothetical protein
MPPIWPRIAQALIELNESITDLNENADEVNHPSLPDILW